MYASIRTNTYLDAYICILLYAYIYSGIYLCMYWLYFMHICLVIWMSIHPSINSPLQVLSAFTWAISWSLGQVKRFCTPVFFQKWLLSKEDTNMYEDDWCSEFYTQTLQFPEREIGDGEYYLFMKAVKYSRSVWIFCVMNLRFLCWRCLDMKL